MAHWIFALFDFILFFWLLLLILLMVLLDFKGSAAAKSNVQYGTTRHDDEYSSESKFLEFQSEISTQTWEKYIWLLLCLRSKPNYMEYFRYSTMSVQYLVFCSFMSMLLLIVNIYIHSNSEYLWILKQTGLYSPRSEFCHTKSDESFN